MSMKQYWRLNTRPAGHDYSAALSLEEEALAPPPAGQVLVRAHYLSMDPGVRIWMTAREDGYSPPIPLGTPMQGQFIGEVLESAHPDFTHGEIVRGFGHWATHSTIDPAIAGLTKLDPEIDDLRQHFGVLGLNGWTALCGLVDVIDLKPGETLLVSAAAGATGSLACQIARNMGCRVIGIAGSDDKCRFLIDELGIDAAINYKSENVAARLQQLGGNIDGYFENVGGDLLDAAMPNMALYGRIGICGLIGGYTSETGLPGPTRFDQILMKRLIVRGIFLPDYMARGKDYYPALKRWYLEGRLKLDFDETSGIGNVLDSFTRLMTGKNTGKVIVDLRG